MLRFKTKRDMERAFWRTMGLLFFVEAYVYYDRREVPQILGVVIAVLLIIVPNVFLFFAKYPPFDR